MRHETTVEMDPEHPADEALRSAKQRHEAGNTEAAIGELRRILVEYPTYGPAYALLTQLVRRRDGPSAAADVARARTLALPAGPWGFHSYGHHLGSCGRHAEAVEAYLAAVRLDP